MCVCVITKYSGSSFPKQCLVREGDLTCGKPLSSRSRYIMVGDRYRNDEKIKSTGFSVHEGER